MSQHEKHRARGQSIGRPKALDASKTALAQPMHALGESANTIAATLGVSTAEICRVLAESSRWPVAVLVRVRTRWWLLAKAAPLMRT